MSLLFSSLDTEQQEGDYWPVSDGSDDEIDVPVAPSSSPLYSGAPTIVSLQLDRPEECMKYDEAKQQYYLERYAPGSELELKSIRESLSFKVRQEYVFIIYHLAFEELDPFHL